MLCVQTHLWLTVHNAPYPSPECVSLPFSNWCHYQMCDGVSCLFSGVLSCFFWRVLSCLTRLDCCVSINPLLVLVLPSIIHPCFGISLVTRIMSHLVKKPGQCMPSDFLIELSLYTCCQFNGHYSGWIRLVPFPSWFSSSTCSRREPLTPNRCCIALFKPTKQLV